jgi:SAM-dependent methyltransferase
MGTVDDEFRAVARTLTSSVIDSSAAGQHQRPGTAGLEEVRDFYERLPYPPPLESLDEHRALYAVPHRRRALFHRIWPTQRPHGHQEILIAGCGTSQAARYALREPGARVTAIDISETSLRHTRDLKQKYALENLELQQLPLENVQQLGRCFDLIVCTGVLHHLPDPDCGLRALRAVLSPKGALQLMVYASYGRAGIYMLQEYCRMLGIGTAAADLRALGGLLEVLPRNHPVAELLGRPDFKRPEAIADALLHPRDRSYTVPELYAWLERCGMSFGRWVEQAPYLPQCGALAKTGHGERLNALPKPAQHAAAELFRGTMTQHRVIAYRTDDPGRADAIHFTGERWREYVPLRLPWALSIREHVPAGSVAVLLNPAHQLRDLVLPINAAQDHLLSQMDGQRTLGDIVAACGSSEAARRAAEFFQQLWWYDQIVFDASGAVAVE